MNLEIILRDFLFDILRDPEAPSFHGPSFTEIDSLETIAFE